MLESAADTELFCVRALRVQCITSLGMMIVKQLPWIKVAGNLEKSLLGFECDQMPPAYK